MLLGGVGSFRNTGHFLETSWGDPAESGFSGCVRRLEINNKIYNFEPAERQGDVLYGVDIGEWSTYVSHLQNKVKAAGKSLAKCIVLS